jgi:uncharacterized membrane-anchored protein YitT (DUF2179 family)
MGCSQKPLTAEGIDMQTPPDTDTLESPTGKRRKINIPRSIRRQFDLSPAQRVGRLLWRQAAITVGALILALGYTIFQVPFKLAAGGVNGLGIILNHYTGFPVGTTYLVLNLPLLLLGYFYLGRFRFLLTTVLAVICFSLSTDLFTTLLPKINHTWPITDDLLLAAIYAGVLGGVGMGIIHRAGGTVGGTSIPARIIYERLGLPMSQSYLYTDSVIILMAGLAFNWEVALLAILTLVLSGIITDTVVEGVSQVRTATIVTQKPDDVRLAIVYQLRRGVSLWPIEGGYQRRARTMLFCTILRSRVADLKYTIATVDPDAFIVIGVAQQVVGGYGKRLPASAIRSS